MGITHFPHGIFAVPTIGTSPNLSWHPDSNVRFVDGVNGSDSNGGGTTPGDAFLTVQAALTACNQYDVIYVMTKPIASSGTGSTGSYTENLTITKTKQMVTMVGIGPFGRPIRFAKLVGVSGTASPVLTVQADSFALENMRFSFATSCTYAIYALYGENTTSYASNLNVYNCRFSGFTSTATIKCVGQQGCSIQESSFVDNLVSIDWRSSTATATDLLIQGNHFATNGATAALISCDILIDAQGSCYIEIIGNVMAHLIPTGGVNRYIQVTNVRGGHIGWNVLGNAKSGTLTEGAAGTGIVCPDNVGTGPNYCCSALMARAA